MIARIIQGVSLFVGVRTMLITMGLLVGIFVAFVPKIAYLVIALPLAIIPLIYIMRPHWGLYTFLIGLPIHSFVMTLLIAQLGLPLNIVRLFAAWKELLLVGMVAVGVVSTLATSLRVRITIVDVTALLWLLLIACYFLFHELLFPWQSPLAARLYGAREWMLYLLPYFAGRLITLPKESLPKIFKILITVGFITSLIGIIERVFIPTLWHVYLGVPRYFGEFLNLRYPAYLFGLPPNYWAEFGGRTVRRVVSTYLSGQGFALPFLVIFPGVMYNALMKPTRFAVINLVVCSSALLLSITRMTILVCMIQAVLLLVMFRKIKFLKSLLIAAGFGLLVLLIVSTSFRTFVLNTVTLQDTSSMARPAQWAAGMQALLERPFGLGLGYSGQVGARFGAGGVGAEAGYFKLTGDLGLLGLTLFLWWFAGIVTFSTVTRRHADSTIHALATITLIGAIGFLLNNFTAPPDQSPFVIYILPWFAGIIVRQITQRELTAHPAPLRPMISASPTL